MKVGVALSGGGTRCVAHLAIIKAFQEHGIEIGCISGTSGGALAASMIAAGMDPIAILELIESTSVLSSIKPAFQRAGLLDVEKSLGFCVSCIPETFEELKIPTYIAATNVRTGATDYFSEGKLLPAVLASCCMPVIFKPVIIGNECYIDGGLVNNLPVEPLRDKCQKLVGIHTNPVDKNFQISGLKSVLERSFLLTINCNVDARKSACDVFIEPDCLVNHKVFDFKKVREIYNLTRQWIEPQMDNLKNSLS